MRWIRVALFSLAGILAVLVVAVAILINVDLGRYKPQIETMVTDLLDRELRIEGVLHASVGSSIEIYAEKVVLANPGWAEQEHFVAVEKLDVAIELWPLLRSTLALERADIFGAVVHIELNEDGAASWSFDGLDKGDKELPPEPNKKSRFPLILHDIVIAASQITFIKPGWDDALVLNADSVRTREPEDDKLELQIKGDLNGTSLNISKTIWPIQNLIDYEDLNVEVKADLGEISVTSSAWIDYVLAPHRPRLDLAISGPNAEYLTKILSLNTITSGPMQIDAKLSPDDDHLSLAVDAVYGEFLVDLNGAMSGLRNFTQIELDASAQGPDIGTILRFLGRTYDDVDRFQLNGTIKRNGKSLKINDVLLAIGDSKLTAEGEFTNFPRPNGANLSIVATGPDVGRFNRLFGMPGRLGGEFHTTLDLAPQDDGRTLARLDANAQHARVKLQSLISATEAFTDTTLIMDIVGPNIATIMDAAGMPGFQAEAFEVNGTVQKDTDGYLVQNVTALVGDDTLKLNGHVGDQPVSGRTDLTFSLDGSDIGSSALARGSVAERLPKGGYRLSGQIQKVGEELRLKNVAAVIGDAREYELGVTGFLSDGVNLAGSELTVQAKGASLAALADLAGVTGIPDYPFEVAAGIRRGVSNTFISDGDFNVGDVNVRFDGHFGDRPLQDDLSLNLDAFVPDLRAVIEIFGINADKIPPGDLKTTAVLRKENGGLSVRSVAVSMNGANLQVAGVVGQPPQLDGTRLDLELSGNNFSRVLPAEWSKDSFNREFAVTGRLSIDNDKLRFDRIKANLGHTTADGELGFGLNPFFKDGSFSMRSESPDLFQLVENPKDLSKLQIVPMQFTGVGKWHDNFWDFTDVQLRLGEGTLSIVGTVDGPPSLDRTDLTVDWHNDSLSNLNAFLGTELPDHALDLRARLLGSADTMTTDSFDLKFGPNDMRGNFTLQYGEVPSITLDVDSRLLDLREYLPKPKDEPVAEEPTAVSADTKLIPQTPLPFDQLRKIDLTLEADIASFKLRRVEWTDFELDFALQDGALEISKFRGTGRRGGRLLASASMTPGPSGKGDFKLSVEGEDLILGFTAISEEDMRALPIYTLRADLAGNGSNLQQLAGSLDGYIRMVGGSGKIRAGALSFFTQDIISQLFSTLNPFLAEDPHTVVDCSALLARFDGGVITGEPVFIQKTEKLLIVGRGNLNLGTEDIDASFRTIPQKGLGIGLTSLVNPYIKLSGTFARPALVLNPEKMIVEGGLAVATGGISFLAKSFKDRFLSDKNPCDTAVADADEQFFETAD